MQLSSHKISYLSWSIALISMLISLIFSDILKFPPCTLCWYQRIFMYPLVFIIPVGILSKDHKIHIYCLVLSLFGLVIAGYHSMIYHGIIQEALKVCTADLSCKTKQFELFGMISIPVMSFISFLIIFILNLQGVRDVKRA
jgi:disulfide bond formation protein DsbB